MLPVNFLTFKFLWLYFSGDPKIHALLVNCWGVVKSIHGTYLVNILPADEDTA